MVQAVALVGQPRKQSRTKLTGARIDKLIRNLADDFTFVPPSAIKLILINKIHIVSYMRTIFNHFDWPLKAFDYSQNPRCTCLPFFDISNVRKKCSMVVSKLFSTGSAGTAQLVAALVRAKWHAGTRRPLVPTKYPIQAGLGGKVALSLHSSLLPYHSGTRDFGPGKTLGI